METQTALYCVPVIPLLYLLWRSRSATHYRLPPGTKGHWLFGHIFGNWFNFEYFSRQAEKLGDIYSLQVFGYNFVVVNSYETIKEAFANDWLTGRMSSHFINEVTHGNHGVILSEGNLWRSHRRFTLAVLRDFGFGKSKIELTIQQELQHLRKEFAAHNGRAFYPRQAYAKAASNVINSIVFDERYSEDPEFESIADALNEVTNIPVSSAFFSIFWPLFKRLPGDLTGLKRNIKLSQKIQNWTAEKLEQHKLTFNEANIRDFIDAFLLESRNRNESDGFTDAQLKQVVFDLFIAGMETTSTTLLWATIFLAQNPDVQQKVYQEIENNIGDSKLPDMGDKAKLRYTEAVLLEVQRFATLVPLGVPHKATETGVVSGYDIPKGSIVIANIMYAHRSVKVWKHPHSFDPHNFLDDDDNLINTNCMLGFSAGKRVCLGESLARQELFIFLVGLVQQYEFVEDATRPLPGVLDNDKSASARSPLPFHVIVRPRTIC